MEPETIDPLEERIAGLVAGSATLNLATLAGQLGMTLNPRSRRRLGAILKGRGWKRQRVPHAGKTLTYWEPAELDPDDRHLRKYLAGRERATIGECCYELRWLPDPEARERIRFWLIGYGWTLSVAEGDEWFRPVSAQAPNLP